MDTLTAPQSGRSLHRRGAVRDRSPDPSHSRRVSHTSGNGHLSVDMGTRGAPSRLSVDSAASGHSYRSTSSMASLPPTPEPIFVELADDRVSFPVPIPHSKPSLSIHIPPGTPPSEPAIVFQPDPEDIVPYNLYNSSTSSSFNSPILPPLSLQPMPQSTFPTTSELRSHPSIMIRRGYTVRRKASAESAESNYAEHEEPFEWERVRDRRIKMAESLLAQRKLDRKRGKRRSLRSENVVIDPEGSWYDPRDRTKHFQDWERREAQALANERRWNEDVELDRGFRAYERGLQRESVITWLQRVH